MNIQLQDEINDTHEQRKWTCNHMRLHDGQCQLQAFNGRHLCANTVVRIWNTRTDDDDDDNARSQRIEVFNKQTTTKRPSSANACASPT